MPPWHPSAFCRIQDGIEDGRHRNGHYWNDHIFFVIPPRNVLFVSIYMFCRPTNMMEWVSVTFGNAKYKMAVISVHNPNTAVSKIALRLRKLLRELMNVRHLTKVQDIPHRPPQCNNVTNVLYCVFIATLIVSLTLAEIDAGYPSRDTATRSAAEAARRQWLSWILLV